MKTHFYIYLIVTFFAGGFLGSYITNVAVSNKGATVYQSTPTKQKPKNEIPTIKEDGYETDEDATPDTVSYLLMSSIATYRTTSDNGQPSVSYFDKDWIATEIQVVGIPKKVDKVWLPDLDDKTLFTGSHILIKDFIVLSIPSGG
jgi:hypothetical protein